MAETRLRDAFEHGVLSDDTYAHLLKGHRLTNDRTRQRSGRAGQICFVLSERIFRTKAWSVYSLLAIWGGEAINFTKAGEAVEHELRTIGSPSVIVAALELSEGQRVHFVALNLLTCFMKAWMGEDEYGGDVFYRAPVPSTEVLDMWQPGTVAYDRFPELPR